MEFEFMTADTVLPPCMPLPTAMLRLPISSTAKIMYARLLDATLAEGGEDTNGILFVRFPIVELAAALSRSSVTVKRSLKVRLCAGGKAALELSVAALFQNAERFRGFVYVGPLPVRIEGAGGFYGTLEKVALCVVDLVLIPQGGALAVYHGSTPLPNTGRRVWSPMPAISA